MGIAYGICSLVNLLPMPDFFAGLLADLAIGAAGVRSVGNDRGFLGAVSGAQSGVD